MANLRENVSSQGPSQSLSNHLNEWLAELDINILFRTCVSCHHFQNSPVWCKKANMAPPGNVILTGCEHYKDLEDIPF